MNKKLLILVVLLLVSSFSVFAFSLFEPLAPPAARGPTGPQGPAGPSGGSGNLTVGDGLVLDVAANNTLSVNFTRLNQSYVRKTGDTMQGNLNLSDYNLTDVDTLFVHNISGRSPINILSPLYSNTTITAATFYGDFSGSNGSIFGLTINNGSIANLLVTQTALFNSNISLLGWLNLTSSTSNIWIDNSPVCTPSNGLCASPGSNASWNQTHANTLYYSITNPSGYYNITTLPAYPTADNTSWNQSYANTLYVVKTGDTMTGNLNMSRNNITQVSSLTFNNVTIKQLPQNGNIDGSVFGIMMTNPPNQELPHLILQSGGPGQASVLLRSLMIQNEINNFSNTTDATSCVAYMSEIGESLQIDCNTTTTGADFLVSDDMQVVGDVWLKDTQGEWHFSTRDATVNDELHSNLYFGNIAYKYNYTHYFLNNTEDEPIVTNIDGMNYYNGMTDVVEVNAGTNTSPMINYISFQKVGNEAVLVNDAVYPGETTSHSDVIHVSQGDRGNNYFFIEEHYQSDTLLYKILDRGDNNFDRYISGLDTTAGSTYLNFSTGKYWDVMNEHESTTALKLNTNGFYFVNASGQFIQCNNAATCSWSYNDGGVIAANAYFNVVVGIISDSHNTSRLIVIPQNTPSSTYTTAASAESDSFNTVTFTSNDNGANKYKMVLVRVIVRKSNGELQAFTNGLYYKPLIGLPIAGASAGGTNDHGLLSGLTDDDHTQYLLRTEYIAGNTSWNETRANSLYYAITNPASYYNVTTLPAYPTADNTSWNETRANTLYASINIVADNTSWNQTHATSLYYLVSNPAGYYNVTTLPTYPVADNSSWNESKANALYYLLTNPASYYNVTTLPAYPTADNTSWNQTKANSLYYLLTNPASYYNVTTLPAYPTTDNTSWNETKANALYAPLSAGNSSWNESYANVKYLRNASIPTCSGTDKLTSAGNGVVTCATDQTSAGGSGITNNSDAILRDLTLNETTNNNYGADFFGNINGSFEASITNANTSSDASVSLCFYNQFSKEEDYNCIGTNGVGYSSATYSAQLPGDMYLESKRNDIHIDVLNASKQIEFYVGGATTGNIKAFINSTGLYENSTGVASRVCTAANNFCGPIYVQSVANTTSISNTVLVNITGLSMPLTTVGNYTIECNLFFKSSAATTGLVVSLSGNVSTVGTHYKYARQFFNTPVSATAQQTLGAELMNTALIGTGSGGVNTTTGSIFLAYVNIVVPINMSIAYRSEISGSTVTVLDGSYCEYQKRSA